MTRLTVLALLVLPTTAVADGAETGTTLYDEFCTEKYTVHPITKEIDHWVHCFGLDGVVHSTITPSGNSTFVFNGYRWQTIELNGEPFSARDEWGHIVHVVKDGEPQVMRLDTCTEELRPDGSLAAIDVKRHIVDGELVLDEFEILESCD